jgi:hypothetical protein
MGAAPQQQVLQPLSRFLGRYPHNGFDLPPENPFFQSRGLRGSTSRSATAEPLYQLGGSRGCPMNGPIRTKSGVSSPQHILMSTQVDAPLSRTCVPEGGLQEQRNQGCCLVVRWPVSSNYGSNLRTGTCAFRTRLSLVGMYHTNRLGQYSEERTYSKTLQSY